MKVVHSKRAAPLQELPFYYVDCNKKPASQLRREMMGSQGIEPWTPGLRVRCSAS